MDYLGKGEVLTNRFRQICEKYLREMDLLCNRKSFSSLSSAHEKREQKQKCCIYIFVQCNKQTANS